MSRWLNPIPRRFLPDEMLVYPAVGDGTFERARLLRHVRFESKQSISSDPHRGTDAGTGKVFVDAVNTEGAFEIPAGSKVMINDLPTMQVTSCTPMRVIRGQVHHWELTVG